MLAYVLDESLHRLIDASTPARQEAPSQEPMILTVVVVREEDQVFVEFPPSTPMRDVLAAMRRAERQYGAAFDLEDPDLWEYLPKGTRIHGFFRDDTY